MLCHFLVASPTVLLPPLLLAIAVRNFAATIAHLFFRWILGRRGSSLADALPLQLSLFSGRYLATVVAL